jgi:hypothetical protein
MRLKEALLKSMCKGFAESGGLSIEVAVSKGVPIEILWWLIDLQELSS